MAEWFPERERALASGIFNSGSALGAILAPPAIVWIVLRFGWPASFLAVGATGLLWLAIWWSVYRTPGERGRTGPGSIGPAKPAERRYTFGELIRTPFVLWFTTGQDLHGPGVVFLHLLVPRVSPLARHFDMAAIGSLRLDSLRRGRARELCWRLDLGAAAAQGLAVTAARKTAVTVFRRV